MACGCKKKKTPAPAVPTAEATYFATNRAMLPNQDVIVQARCTNCVGLLRTIDGKYLPMHTHEFYPVLLSDTKRWMGQGWIIEVKHGA